VKQHRKLGPVLATIVVAGNMIGSGIFLLPATLAGVGSLTLIGWLAASLGAVALAIYALKLLLPPRGKKTEIVAGTQPGTAD